MKMNVPNQITLGRLILALLFFVLLSWFDADNNPRWLLLVCFWVFLAAALGDILDGLLARWLKQVTPFGRIVDPVVDKVMVCGAFVLFAGANFVHEGRNITGVAPWMAIVILVRELLVSAIRAHAEASGTNFAAVWAGKMKMFVQCATVLVILGQLGWQVERAAPVRTACIWLTIVITVVSIAAYVRRAYSFLASTTQGDGAARAAEPAATSPSNQEKSG